VIVNDLENFSNAFPEALPNVITQEFNFSLSKGGELVSLYNSDLDIIDFFEYDDSFPWPVEPDGAGSSLELLNPSYINSIGSNWAGSINSYGIPGRMNSVFEKK